MPLTASSVRPLLASSTWPDGATTYGLSPACMTMASPSMLTIAWRSEGTRLIAKCTYRHVHARPLARRFVDSNELDELVAFRLVRGDDAFRLQVLQHVFVGVIGRADLGRIGQTAFEIRDGHLLVRHDLRAREKPEPACRLRSRARLEHDEDLVAHEVVVGFRAAGRRVFHADERDAVDRLQAIDECLREGAFSRPLRRVDVHQIFFRAT